MLDIFNNWEWLLSCCVTHQACVNCISSAGDWFKVWQPENEHTWRRSLGIDEEELWLKEKWRRSSTLSSGFSWQKEGKWRQHMTAWWTDCHQDGSPLWHSTTTPPPQLSGASAGTGYVHIKEMSIILTVRIHALRMNESRSRKERLKGICE